MTEAAPPSTPAPAAGGGASAWAPERRRAALWTPALFGLGAQVYFLAPAEPSLAALAAALAAALLLAVWSAGAGEAARAAALALACALAGFGWAGAKARMVAAPVLADEVEALVEGRIESVSQSAAGRPRLTLAPARLWGLAPEATPARVRVTLLSARHAEGLAPGDRVSVMAVMRPPGGPAAPGGFDFARAAWFERLGAVGVARGRVARLPAEPAAGPLAAAGEALDRARSRLGAALRARIGGEAGAFAAAIVTGDRAGLPVEALASLRDSGLAHLLAISGLHMAIVCGLVFGGVRLALAATGAAAGPLAARFPAKSVAAVAALAAGAAYLLVSGASVATQRAFVMAAVALTAMLAGRAAVTLRGLAAAAWVVLLVAPEAVLSVGFQMSFAATLALVAAYEAARDRSAGPRRRGVASAALRYVGALAATSLIAGLATAPFAAFHFNRAAVYGLAANLGGVPLMGLVVAPALAGALALAPFGLEGPALAAAGFGIERILAVSNWVAGLHGSVRLVPAAPPAALWLTVAGGLWLCLWRGRLRLAALAPLGLAAALWSAPAPFPALVVAEDGAVAAQGPGGLLIDAPGDRGFARETWLRRAGVAEDAALSFAREGRAATATLQGGWRVVVWRARRLDARALAGLCGPATLVVAPAARAPGSARWDRLDPAVAARRPTEGRRSPPDLAQAGRRGTAWAGATLEPSRCAVLDAAALAMTGPVSGDPVSASELRGGRATGGPVPIGAEAAGPNSDGGPPSDLASGGPSPVGRVASAALVDAASRDAGPAPLRLGPLWPGGRLWSP